jgi:hypothetical protein
MSLLEETYKPIDPEGEINLAFDDLEVREAINSRNQKNASNGISSNGTKKNGIDILDA